MLQQLVFNEGKACAFVRLHARGKNPIGTKLNAASIKKASCKFYRTLF